MFGYFTPLLNHVKVMLYFKFPKIDQNLHANVEGFAEPFKFYVYTYIITCVTAFDKSQHKDVHNVQTRFYKSIALSIN